MPQKPTPYVLTQQKALFSLQKTMMRIWDDAQEAFDQVGESPIASHLNGLITTLADQTMYLIKADCSAGVYGLHEQALGLVNLTMGLNTLLEDSNLGKAFDASHLVATAQLEGGMNIHVLNAFQLEENEEGSLFLEPPREYITPDGHMNPNMKAAADALVSLGKIHPKVIESLPDVSPCALLDTDEEEGLE